MAAGPASQSSSKGQNGLISIAPNLVTGCSDASLIDDDEAVLAPGSGSQDVNVTSQVREWLSGQHANNGFVIWGPLPIPTEDAHPSDNNAEVSWYQNFRLKLLYDPTKNPNAPK